MISAAVKFINICSYSSSMQKVCQKNKIGHIKKKGQKYPFV